MIFDRSKYAYKVVNEVSKVILGKEDVICKVWMAILSGGHILLEDVPGVGKTQMALAFSKALGLDHKRIQFTPDVMPSDITGFYYYNKVESAFFFREGAAMTNLLLADEINRTSSRTQAALLEVMEEKHVTVDGVTHDLPDPFFVIATQNPLGSAGTQVLPESQLDRFMIQLTMGYPKVDDEVLLLKDRGKGNPLDEVVPCYTKEELLKIMKEVEEIYISDAVYKYIAALGEATRKHDLILLGVSPRGSLALCRMARAHAYLSGRNYVTPEDVQDLVADVYGHRIILKPKAKISGRTLKDVMEEILSHVRVPEKA